MSVNSISSTPASTMPAGYCPGLPGAAVAADPAGDPAGDPAAGLMNSTAMSQVGSFGSFGNLHGACHFPALTAAMSGDIPGSTQEAATTIGNYMASHGMGAINTAELQDLASSKGLPGQGPVDERTAMAAAFLLAGPKDDSGESARWRQVEAPPDGLAGIMNFQHPAGLPMQGAAPGAGGAMPGTTAGQGGANPGTSPAQGGATQGTTPRDGGATPGVTPGHHGDGGVPYSMMQGAAGGIQSLIEGLEKTIAKELRLLQTLLGQGAMGANGAYGSDLDDDDEDDGEDPMSGMPAMGQTPGTFGGQGGMGANGPSNSAPPQQSSGLSGMIGNGPIISSTPRLPPAGALPPQLPQSLTGTLGGSPTTTPPPPGPATSTTTPPPLMSSEVAPGASLPLIHRDPPPPPPAPEKSRFNNPGIGAPDLDLEPAPEDPWLYI